MKARAHRQLTPADEALFAAYREHRERARPPACTADPERCWVERGPPAIASTGFNSRCLGCGDTPRMLLTDRLRHYEALNR